MVADDVVPVIFGERWTPALDVFPYVAAAYLVMAAFILHSSLLYVLRRNRRVAEINAVRLLAQTALSVTLLPVVGIAGYGIALLASQATAVLLDQGEAAHPRTHQSGDAIFCQLSVER